MAYSFSSISSQSFLLLPLFLAILLAFINPASASQFAASKVTKDISSINQVCPKTNNPPVCVQVLKGDCCAVKADLPSLCQNATGLAYDIGKEVARLIASLSKNVTDPKVKDRFYSCSENFDMANDNLDRCKKSLRSKDYVSVNDYSSAALTEADTCNEDWLKEYPEPHKLKQANQKFQDYVCIVLAISAILREK